MAYPHFGRDFLLETDASGVGLGAVLSQEHENKGSSTFASRTLLQHEKNCGISELEALAVVHFRHYLYGYRCIVFTDHEALKSLLNTPQPSGKLAWWGMALQGLDLRIESAWEERCAGRCAVAISSITPATQLSGDSSTNSGCCYGDRTHTS